MDNHRAPDNIIYLETACQNLEMSNLAAGQQRRQVAGVVRMRLPCGVVVTLASGKFLTFTVSSFVYMKTVKAGIVFG